MSLDDQFDSTTNQAVNDALAAKHADQGSQPGLPSTLRTTGGGETLSPYTQESLGTSFIGEHGSIATSYNIERTIQGTQSLEVVASDQQDARIGGTGPIIGSNGFGLFPQITPASGISVASELHNTANQPYGASGTTFSVALTNTPVASVSLVYSGSTTYSGNNGGINGAGWTLAGNNIVFSNGTYTNYFAAASGNQVPASGGNFYVNYTYTAPAFNIPAPVNYTMEDNQGQDTVFIPNVNTRFAR